jgi:hypothetical protein
VDFTAADLTLVNAAATLTGAGADYVATLTPDADGEVSLSVAAGVFTDAAGNGNAASAIVSTTVDTTPPTVEIVITGPVAGVFTATITLSEPSPDFGLDTLVLENATGVLSGAGTDFVLLLTPLGDGPVTVALVAGAFTDVAGNPNPVVDPVAVIFDATPPTVALAAPEGPSDGIYTVAITLSEVAVGFAGDDLLLSNATAALSGAGTAWVAVLTPVADGVVTLAVPSGAFTDAAGNPNLASDTVSVTHDATPPALVLESATETFAGPAVLTITLTASEAVIGLALSDIVVTNGRASALTGSGTRFAITVAATGGGDLALRIPAGAAVDVAGNPSRASNRLVIVSRTVERTQEIIGAFLQTRLDALAAHQPDLAGLLAGGGGNASAAVTRGSGRIDIRTRTGGPLWGMLQASWGENGAASDSYVFGVIGGHARLSPNLLTGMMLQADRIEARDGAVRVEGTGWLAGPYVVARLPGHSLTVDARLLAGRSRNDITPFGTYTDRFTTARMLAQVGVTGAYTTGGLRLVPSLAVLHARDRQHAYVDGPGNVIGAQDARLTEWRAGLRLETAVPIPVGTGALSLAGGVQVIGAHRSGTGPAAALLPPGTDPRGRIDLGLAHVLENGGRITLDAFHDGIGDSAGRRRSGVSLGFEVAF